MIKKNIVFIYVLLSISSCNNNSSYLNRKAILKDFQLEYSDFMEKYSVPDSVYWNTVFLFQTTDVRSKLNKESVKFSVLVAHCLKQKNENLLNHQNSRSLPDSLDIIVNKKSKNEFIEDENLNFNIKLNNYSKDTIRIDTYVVGFYDPIGKELFQLTYIPINFPDTTIILPPFGNQIVETGVKLGYIKDALESKGLKYFEDGEVSFLSCIGIEIRSIKYNDSILH